MSIETVAPAPASGDLMVYFDAEGRVWARNPASGVARLLSGEASQPPGGPSPLAGAWASVPVNPGYTGGISTIEARWVIDPVIGLVELKGSITGGGTWLTTPQLIATLPAGLRPAGTRNLLVPSNVSSASDYSASWLFVSGSGQMILAGLGAFTYSVDPQVAFFGGTTFPLP